MKIGIVGKPHIYLRSLFKGLVMEKDKGLYQKYDVIKLSNPRKRIDAIVLEFDDPIAREGIKAWSQAMEKAGYAQVASEVNRKLHLYNWANQADGVK